MLQKMIGIVIQKLLMRGVMMFRYYTAKKIEQRERLRLPYQEYIYTSIRPSKDMFDGLQEKIETELKGDIKDMRREFRRMAKKVRSLYSH